MTNKEIYIQYCNSRADIPVFFQYYWLDTVCTDGEWDVLINSNEVEISGFYVYFKKRKYGLQLLVMPPLTPFLGILYNYPKQPLKKERKIAFELEVSKKLIDKLPSFFYCNMNMPPSVQNFLSFKWAKFKQTTKFTYVIDTSLDEYILWNQLKDKTRNIIRKAKQTIQIESSLDIKAFDKLNNQTFKRQQMPLPYDGFLIKNLYRSMSVNNAVNILLASNNEKENVAGVFLVNDSQKIYCLAIGSNETARRSGAVALCIWKGILLAKKLNLLFDFEGSVLENIEPFFRILWRKSS